MNKTGVAKCYEVDTLTMGSRYYRSVESKNCISESTRFTWVPTSDKSGRCFSIDLRTGVKSKVKRDDCRPENPIYEFVRTGPFKGYCLEKSINAENAYAQKSKIEKCKPTETSYIFYKAEGEMSGKCYELDIESNGNNYLDKVDAKYCK